MSNREIDHSRLIGWCLFTLAVLIALLAGLLIGYVDNYLHLYFKAGGGFSNDSGEGEIPPPFAFFVIVNFFPKFVVLLQISCHR